jgi:lysozyme
MNISPLGIAVIQLFENYASKAYRKFPSEPWTCGWGHTGKDVTATTVCTPAQALGWLISDTGAAATAVTQDVKVSITQHQFDALASLVYNAGQGALEHRTGQAWTESTLLTELNAGNVTTAANQFLQWDHVNGKSDAGLLRRRQLEMALFMDGVSQ